MLIRFNVENFLSFYKKSEFSMIAGTTRNLKDHVKNLKLESEELKLLKGSFIYGANGSGKSNFIKSIEFARECIINGLEGINTVGKTYRLNKLSENNLSEFEFEIILQEKAYAYGFNLNLLKKEINEEWLYEIGCKNDILIYKRVGNKFEISKNELNEKDKLRLDVYLENLKPDELILSIIGKSNFEKINIYSKIFNWFNDDLIIITPNTQEFLGMFFIDFDNLKKYLKGFDISIIEKIFIDKKIDELEIPDNIKVKLSNDIAKFLREDQQEKKKNKVMTKIHVNINNSPYEIEKDSENNLIAKEIKFKHKSSDGTFSYREESDGTKRLLELIPILEIIKCNKVVLIDELERSLHPILVKAYVDEMYKSIKNKKSQFIITTHESRLIDLEDIRRDEIWFCLNDEKNGSKLKSLNEYNIRNDYKADKGYLLGRFGGIPEIVPIVEGNIPCDENA